MEKYDISSENWREYHYKDGSSFHIENPITLYLKRDEKEDSHRIVNDSGVTFYPVKGWIAISWDAPKQNVSF